MTKPYTNGGDQSPPKRKRQSMLDMARGLATKTSATVPVAGMPGSSEKTDFATLPAYKEMRRHRAVADVMGVENPFFRLHEGRSGATCTIDGRTYDNFISYDYVGLNGSPEVDAAAKNEPASAGGRCARGVPSVERRG